MASWSARVFFFLFMGFLLYVIARGDGSQWKAIFTQSSTGAAAPSASQIAPAGGLT